jgi:uncharacterized protein YjeT (DUF2065 family)
VSDFLCALGLVLVIEGVLYVLFPEPMKRMLVRLATQPSSLLRAVGLAATALGVVIVWLVRG